MKEVKEVMFLVEESEEGGYEAKALGSEKSYKRCCKVPF